MITVNKLPSSPFLPSFHVLSSLLFTSIPQVSFFLFLSLLYVRTHEHTRTCTHVPYCIYSLTVFPSSFSLPLSFSPPASKAPRSSHPDNRIGSCPSPSYRPLKHQESGLPILFSPKYLRILKQKGYKGGERAVGRGRGGGGRGQESWSRVRYGRLEGGGGGMDR